MTDKFKLSDIMNDFVKEKEKELDDEIEHPLTSLRHCNYCKQMKELGYRKRYCDECEILAAEENLKKKYAVIKDQKDIIYQEYREYLKNKPCKRCNEGVVPYPKNYCEKCIQEIYQERKKKNREKARKIYHEKKDEAREILKKRSIEIRAELEEKYNTAVENLGEKQLKQLIFDHFDKVSLEDLKNEVYKLYPELKPLVEPEIIY